MEVLLTRCPQCGSDNVRFREKRNNWICDDCDFVFTSDEGGIASQNDTSINKTRGRIFVSYGHDCSDFVNRIKKDLEFKGYEVWVDAFDIKSGDDWRNAIVNGILGSQAVLVFLSTHSLRQGGVCLDEIAIAVGCNKSVIRTCLMEKEALGMIPSTINGIEYVDLTLWNHLEGSQFEQWYAAKFMEICHNIESALKFQEDPVLREVEQRLHPCITFDDQYIELRKPFTEREWLTKLVDNWIDDKSNRTLLMTAYPGGGKSAFCAHFFHFHPLTVCLTMCKQYLDGADETRQILKNIAFQIAHSSIGYRRNLLLVLNNNVGLDLASLDIQSLFNLLICTPFQLEIDGGHPPVIIVVDGVDALDVGEQNVLSELFSNNMSRLPSFVSVMFSARHSGSVINGFMHSSWIDINPNSEETIKDIEKFLLQTTMISGNLIRRVAERCHGSFLYASFLSKAINEGSVEIDKGSFVLPQLQGLYYQSMRHVFSDDSMFETYWRPMAFLIAWGGEMPTGILQDYMHWKPYEYNRFYSRLMVFLRHRVDVKGNRWVGVVYPSFIAWMTEENEANIFSIPLPKAHKELSDVMWSRYLTGVKMSDVELVKMFDLLEKAEVEERMARLKHDSSLMRDLLGRIKEYNDDPRDYQTMLQLLDFCQDIANAIDSEEARVIGKGELPFIRIRHDFSSSDYVTMLNRYRVAEKDIEKYCTLEQKLHILYMISTGRDMIGRRQDAVQGFVRLLEEARKSNMVQYEFYALVGLLWNDHFTNIEEGRKLVHRLGAHDFDMLGVEDKLLQRLMVARFKLSTGDLEAAFGVFNEVMTSESEFVWGYGTISVRIQMLLIESLVAAYDNCEYQKGIDLGRCILDHIGDSLSIAACYCLSWMAMNYLQCGRYAEAEQMLVEAERKNERLQIIGPSKWMLMHLKSVRSVLCARLDDLETAVSLLWEVVKLAKETNDTWVLGDAYFDLFCHHWFSGFSLSDKQQTFQLYLKLQRIADESELPHLKYKALVMKNALMPDKDGAELLWSETQRLVLGNALASTDAIVVLYLCRAVYGIFFPDSKSVTMMGEAIWGKCREIDAKNPGIDYLKRNRIVRLISEK